MNSPTIPQNRTQLYLFWFLVDNAGRMTIPYEAFAEILYSYSIKQRIQQEVSTLRPFIEMNGYSIETVFDVGYKVRKETR